MDAFRFNQTINNEINLNKNQPVVIGVSGGPDSLCLLHLAFKADFLIVAAHLDHGLRESSGVDAARVRAFCGQFGIRFVGERVDVIHFSREAKLGIEEAARVARYRFLFDTAEATGAQAVLVAHHADDQVESVLMHLLRGTGVAGLRGMRMVLVPNSWSNTIPLIRPLLKNWRYEILDYCRAHGLKPIEDETNQDTRIHRNRIRHELIPMLETYNKNFKENLLKSIEIIQSEDDLLESQQITFRKELVQKQGQDYLLFDRAGFSTLRPAMQRRLIRDFIKQINSNVRDIEFDLVEKIREFIARGNTTNFLQLYNGMEMFCNLHDYVVLGKGNYTGLWPQLMKKDPVSVSIPSTVEIGGGFRFEVFRSLNKKIDESEWRGIIDASKVIGNLFLRTFKNGDRFLPYGLNGKQQKLGDFWTNTGLPKKARATWPLLCDDQGIIWVPGFRIANRCQVTKEASDILEVLLIRGET